MEVVGPPLSHGQRGLLYPHGPPIIENGPSPPPVQVRLVTGRSVQDILRLWRSHWQAKMSICM